MMIANILINYPPGYSFMKKDTWGQRIMRKSSLLNYRRQAHGVSLFHRVLWTKFRLVATMKRISSEPPAVNRLEIQVEVPDLAQSGIPSSFSGIPECGHS